MMYIPPHTLYGVHILKHLLKSVYFSSLEDAKTFGHSSGSVAQLQLGAELWAAQGRADPSSQVCASVAMATLWLHLSPASAVQSGQGKRSCLASSPAWCGCHVQDLLGYIFNYYVLLITPFDFPGELPFCSFCDSP